MPTESTRSSMNTIITPEVFCKMQFDYIVIGGGTAGMIVSARLAEDPSVTVGVIEAGALRFDDPNVDIPRDETWSWSNLLPYMKKSERVPEWPRDPYPGISVQDSADATLKQSIVNGTSGPIAASRNSHYFDVTFKWVQTLNNLGVKTNASPYSGNATGVYNSLSTVNRSNGTRSYAVEYYGTHSKLSNYHLLIDAQATKILFSANGEGLLVATGVE